MRFEYTIVLEVERDSGKPVKSLERDEVAETLQGAIESGMPGSLSVDAREYTVVSFEVSERVEVTAPAPRVAPTRDTRRVRAATARRKA